MYIKIVNGELVIANNKIVNRITGVRVGVIEMHTTKRCRREYSLGSPIRIIKLWLN